MSSKRGTRSPRAIARRYALLTAFYDRRVRETVCLTDTLTVLAHVHDALPDADGVDVHLCAFDRGEVLINQQGTGSLQQGR